MGNRRKNKGKCLPPAPPLAKPVEEPQPLDSDEEREREFMRRVKEARERVVANLEAQGLATSVEEKSEKAPLGNQQAEMKVPDSFISGSSSFTVNGHPSGPKEGVSSLGLSPIGSIMVQASPITSSEQPLSSLSTNTTENVSPTANLSSPSLKLTPSDLIRFADSASTKSRNPNDAPFTAFEFQTPSLKNAYSVRAHDFVIWNLRQLWMNSCYTTSPVFGNASAVGIARHFLTEIDPHVAQGHFLSQQNKTEWRTSLTGCAAAASLTPSNDLEAQPPDSSVVLSMTSSIDDLIHAISATDLTANTTGLNANDEPCDWSSKTLNDMVEEQREENAAAERANPPREPKVIHDFEPYQRWIAIWATAFVNRAEREQRSERMKVLAPIAAERQLIIQPEVHPAIRNANHESPTKSEPESTKSSPLKDKKLKGILKKTERSSVEQVDVVTPRRPTEDTDRIHASLKKAGFF